MSPFLLASIIFIVVLLCVILIWHYHSAYSEIAKRVDLLNSELDGRNKQLVSVVDDFGKQQIKYQKALANLNVELDSLEKLLDECANPSVVRARLNELGGMLSVLDEKRDISTATAHALADPQGVSEPTSSGIEKVGDKGT